VKENTSHLETSLCKSQLKGALKHKYAEVQASFSMNYLNKFNNTGTQYTYALKYEGK
jgi:hypothetical protein